jgi:orotate phosphoribosyltransferase
MPENHSEEDWRSLFTDMGAFWLHDDNPERPHALLTSGVHSNGFFNWGVVAEQPIIARQAVNDLAARMEMTPGLGSLVATVSRVVGPAYGAITLANDLALLFSITRSGTDRCFSGFTVKQPDGSMELRQTLRAGERVLVCEDTVTTGKSVNETIRAVEAAGGQVLPFIAAICNRSGLGMADNHAVISLLTVSMKTWQPHECELCKQGSEAIRPKQEGNWARLTQ